MRALGQAGQFGFGLAQGALGLFAAGGVLVSAHNLLLRYYANEWTGIQFTGPNRCAGESLIANGDLIDGAETICRQPVSFMPWLALYERHPLAVAFYYGAALLLIIAVGLVWIRMQRRAVPTPFGRAHVPAAGEHLR